MLCQLGVCHTLRIRITGMHKHIAYTYILSVCLSALSASDATACGICQLIFCCTLLEIHTLCMPLLLHPSRKPCTPFPFPPLSHSVSLFLSLSFSCSLQLRSHPPFAVFFVLACILHIAERNFNLRRQQPSHACASTPSQLNPLPMQLEMFSLNWFFA